MKNQNRKNRAKSAGKAELSLLFGIVIVASGAGVWTEVHAAGAQVDKTKTSFLEADAYDSNANAYLSGRIEELPDGTAWVSASVDTPSAWIIGEELTTNYALSVNVSPGGSGKPGSGTGSGTVTGEDWLNGGPLVTMGLELAVENATEAFSYNNHNLMVAEDGSAAYRVHESGASAWTSSGGSVSITIDGGSPYTGTGGSGQVRANTSHSIQKLNP